MAPRTPRTSLTRALAERAKGFGIAAAVIITLIGYIFVRHEGRVDIMAVDLDQAEKDIENLEDICEHVSAARMVTIDTTNNTQSEKIKALEVRVDECEEDLAKVKRRLRIR